MTKIVYTDQNGIDHDTNVDLAKYKRFGDLLRDVYAMVNSDESEASFILGVYENDPDLFEDYLKSRYWQNLPEKVRDAVVFLVEPDYEFGNMTSFHGADSTENEIVRAYGNPTYYPDEFAFFNAYRDKYSYNIMYLVRILPDYETNEAFWDKFDQVDPPNRVKLIYDALKKGVPEFYHFPEFVTEFREWTRTLDSQPPLHYGAPEPDLERFVRDTLYALQSTMSIHTGVQNPDDILLMRKHNIKVATQDPQSTESLVDTLKDVIDFNVSEDGVLDVKDGSDEDEDDGPTPYDPKRDNSKAFGEEYEEGEEKDYTNLDTDFDWEFYDEMRPGKRPWPIRDHSILYDPAAITRYNVDFYMNVAKTKKS